jgi:hypothetical protein
MGLSIYDLFKALNSEDRRELEELCKIHASGLEQEEKEEIQANNIIPAARLIRIRTGCGLGVAKFMITDYQEKLKRWQQQ